MKLVSLFSLFALTLEISECGGAVPSLMPKVQSCIDRLDNRLGQ